MFVFNAIAFDPSVVGKTMCIVPGETYSPSHKHAIRLQPRNSTRCGRSSFADHRTAGAKKRTPVVLCLQRRLNHRVSPGDSTSCNVNSFTLQISPKVRCSVRGQVGTSTCSASERCPSRPQNGLLMFPRSPSSAAVHCGLFFGSDA